MVGAAAGAADGGVSTKASRTKGAAACAPACTRPINAGDRPTSSPSTSSQRCCRLRTDGKKGGGGGGGGGVLLVVSRGECVQMAPRTEAAAAGWVARTAPQDIDQSGQIT